MDSNKQNLINKILYRAQYRGTKEMDIFVSKFVNSIIDNLDHKELVSLDKLKLLMSEGVPLIDIRTAKEWKETGVIKDSHLITFFNENGEVDIYKWLNELELVADKNKPLILICRSGRRTGIVSDYLDKYFEFFKIYDATDGIKEWKKINPLSKNYKS